jgi:alpha-1,3/alpha-1,6-mannosyltransferase
MRVAFLHPDMGIGGAEQLVVNLAMCFKTQGSYVKIFTPSYDSSRAFDQIKNGTIDLEVRGNIFPRRIFGKFQALCEYVRMLCAAIYLILYGGNFDYVVVDQIPLAVPLLNIRFNTLFYCHYPDKLLCTERTSFVKRLYRFVIDVIEEVTMLFSKAIVVNSKYTQGVFLNNFRIISKLRQPPSVIYPCIDLNDYDRKVIKKEDLKKVRGLESLQGKNLNEYKVIVSLNRYERKKNLDLAVQSFIHYMDLLKRSNTDDRLKHILILAGGYDTSLNENIEVYNRLKAYDFEDYKENIFFLKNISSDERSIILCTANIVLYTPKNEHFGIVPVESMYCGAYVIAHKSGGPTESVIDGVTGRLLDNEDPKEWGKKIQEYFYPTEGDINIDVDSYMNTGKLRSRLREHVLANFSLNTMEKDLLNIVAPNKKLN